MQIKTEIKDICLNGGDIERMVAAMAQQIVQGEGAAASPVLVGLNTKGLAIAKRLARHMALLRGRTARKALDVLGGIGTPASLQLAVLVDRLFPNPAACPNVVGVQLDVSANERLLVFLEEIDGFSEVLVRRGW